MNPSPGIYWIQGLVGGEWSNLQRCEDQADAVARLGRLTHDRRYRELRLVLAQVQRGQIRYTTLAIVRDGEFVPDTVPFDTPPPEARGVAAKRKDTTPGQRWRLPVLIAILVAAIGAGLGSADRFPQLARAVQEHLGWPAGPAAPAVAARQPGPRDLDYADRLFQAVDNDDGPGIRQLMVDRPGDLHLDELLLFVDDGWNTGPRKIVDYALLGGHLTAAEALLSAGAVPSEWLLDLLRRHPDTARLRPAIALLGEFGIGRPASLNRAIMETAREFSGR